MYFRGSHSVGLQALTGSYYGTEGNRRSMASKDIVSKRLLQRIALDIARLLLGLDVDEAELLDTESRRVEQRCADLVLKMRGAEGCFLVHIEIQNNNQREMPWRMLRYRTDIVLAHPGLAVRQFLIYIGRAKMSMAERAR